ncbi:efflux RND transporter permease subunit [Sphingobacterium spiritivorum]|uniref:efflux RND transporter permease subunit n=1 Tax=Sphingobacterium spiritivorum TaxID=258 RepID=UPI003DA5E4E8
MFDIFIKRPILSLVISVFITLLGLLSLFTLPVTQFPDIVPPSVVVTANYTGANAEVSTNAVAIPLEKAINGVAGMTSMSTVSTNNGNTLIQIFFKVGTDPDIAAVNVQNRVTTVLDELPEEVIKAGVTTEKEVNSMLMYLNIFSEDKNADERFIYNFTDINILKELKRIEGVGFAQIMGMRDYAMRIWLKPDRLAAYNISTDEVIQSLRSQNIEAAPGQTGIGSDKVVNMQQYVLRYTGKFTEASEYENIPIRANADGSVLRIKDIATLEFGSLDYEMVSKTDGRPSASIMMKQLPGSNAQDVINNVKKRMAELKESSFPPGMTYTMGYDVSRFLDASISSVITTLIEAFLLVFLVVFIFLQDFRSTLIPALAVPVCLIGALFFMQMLGFSINLLTLFALVLAIGIVVDNAIVVVEAVYAKMEDDETLTPREATFAAMKEVGSAIIAITLVMSAVFIPVAFLSGPVGIFYRQFSLTLASAIVISGINALTLTPALCALMLKSPHGKEKKNNLLNRFFNGFNKWYNNTSGKYAIIVRTIASRRVITTGLLIISFVATWGMSSILPGGFIPTEDQGMIYVNVTTPPGATVDRTEAVMNEIDRVSRELKPVETVSTLSGYSLVNEVSGSSYGMGMINLTSWSEREQNVWQIIEELKTKTKHIKDAEIEFFPPPTVPGFGNSSGFELRVLDRSGKDDLTAFSKVLETFMEDLKNTPEVGNVFTSFETNFPQYMLHIDYDLAAKKGISVENSMNTLQTLMGSFYATNFIRYGQMYKVMVQADAMYRQKPEDVLKLFVKNDKGEMVPFSAFMRMQRVYGPEQITRYNMFASAMLNGDPADGYSSGQVISAIERVAKEKLPAGYTFEWSGMTKEQKASGNQAVYIFGICLLFVYLLLCAQYESFLLPLPVLFSLPAGIFGAFLFLKVFGLENNIYAQVALVMLIGLLGKNAILIIEYAVIKHKQGLSVIEAAIEAAVMRLRPILMTSFAFAAGLVPLAMASGAGALGNRSIGLAALGGMLIGTIFGVLIIPGLYVLFNADGKKDRKKTSRKIAEPVAGIILILVLFSACKVRSDVRDSYIPSKIPVTDTAAIDSAFIHNLHWNTFFKDENLKQLIDTALVRSPDLGEALERIEFSKTKLRLRKGEQLPQVDAAIEGSLSRFGDHTIDGTGIFDQNLSDNISGKKVIPNPVPDYFIGIRSVWELDIWGKLRNLKNAALHEYLASYEGRKLVQSELVTSIATRYYDLVALDAEQTAIQENIKLQSKSLEIMEVMKKAGTANSLSVSQFQAALLQAKAREKKGLQQIREIENEINYLIGRFNGEIIRTPLTAHNSPVFSNIKPEHADQLLASRPDIRQAGLQLIAAGLETDAAKANLYPSLVLAPQLGLNSFRIEKLLSSSSLAYSLIGGLSGPILNRTALNATYDQYKANYGIQFYQYEKTVLKAWQELYSQLEVQDYARERQDMLSKQVDVLNEAAQVSNDLFIAGRATYLDILSAQKSALEASIDKIESRKENILIQLNIYKALGGGW